MQNFNSRYDGKRFQNLIPRKHGVAALVPWLLTRRPGHWNNWTNAATGPPPLSGSHDLRITYINHTTFLLQMEGVNILTDPFWAERASPVSWAGPRRVRPAGIRLEDLPAIHAILLSHDHYDHMDIPTLQRLVREHDAPIYTALKNASTLAKYGIRKVVELDWWQSAVVGNGLRVTAIPAQHFSGRYLWNRDRALWCGFMLQGSSATVCFAADTGMGPHFAEIARRFPDIDLAILPIGAFRPEWFMREIHMSPADAVEAHRILGARISVASHFGTVPLADDGEFEPVDLLHEALAKTDLGATEFWVLGFGEGRNIPRAANGSSDEVQATGPSREQS